MVRCLVINYVFLRLRIAERTIDGSVIKVSLNKHFNYHTFEDIFPPHFSSIPPPAREIKHNMEFECLSRSESMQRLSLVAQVRFFRRQIEILLTRDKCELLNGNY